MINLLPPDVKSSYSYARRNVGLLRWVMLFAIALVGFGAIVTFGLLSMQQSTQHTQNEITQQEATFKQEKYAETQKQVKDIGSSFKLVVQVLSNEVLFSKLLKQIAATIPAKASLTGLTINQSQTAIDISATAADYATATQIQVNLSDPTNKIFSKADIVSINCNAQNTGDSSKGQSIYPCAVSIRALFSNNNPYLFVNSTGGKK